MTDPISYEQIIADCSLQERQTVALESIAESLVVLAADVKIRRNHLASVQLFRNASVHQGLSTKDNEALSQHLTNEEDAKELITGVRPVWVEDMIPKFLLP